jgi:hypothetical protein
VSRYGCQPHGNTHDAEPSIGQGAIGTRESVTMKVSWPTPTFAPDHAVARSVSGVAEACIAVATPVGAIETTALSLLHHRIESATTIEPAVSLAVIVSWMESHIDTMPEPGPTVTSSEGGPSGVVASA